MRDKNEDTSRWGRAGRRGGGGKRRKDTCDHDLVATSEDYQKRKMLIRKMLISSRDRMSVSTYDARYDSRYTFSWLFCSLKTHNRRRSSHFVFLGGGVIFAVYLPRPWVFSIREY